MGNLGTCHSGEVLYLVFSVCSVWNVVHPWQTPSFKAEIQVYLLGEVFPDSCSQTVLHTPCRCSHTLMRLCCCLHMHLCPPLGWKEVRIGTGLLIFMFPGLRTGSGWTEESSRKSNCRHCSYERIYRVTDCLRFLPRMEVLLIIEIGQLRNHNLLALYRAENAITIETLMIPACEQAI